MSRRFLFLNAISTHMRVMNFQVHLLTDELFNHDKIDTALEETMSEIYCPEWKLHLSLRIAMFKIQNSILNRKCSLLKMKLAFTVENQVWAKWKQQFLRKWCFGKLKITFFLKIVIFQNKNTILKGCKL